MNVEIRPATTDDAAAIVAVLNPIIEAGVYTAFDTPFSVAEERRYISDLPPRAIFLVAVNGETGTIVGFQSLEPFATYTHAFDHVGVVGTYVDLRYHRRGIASRLFSAMFDAARRQGFEKILTFIRSDNEPALATYLHHGFQVVGAAERQAKIGDKYIDEVIIECFL
jgi:L-amino acid N-acyltransferase YncA